LFIHACMLMECEYCPPAGAPSSWSWCARLPPCTTPLGCPGTEDNYTRLECAPESRSVMDAGTRDVDRIDIVDSMRGIYTRVCGWRLPQRRPKTARVTRLTLRLKHTVAHDYTHHPDILPCLLRGPTPSPTLPLSVYSYLLYGNLLSHHGARYRNHREVSSSVTSLHPPFMQQSTHFESNRAGVDGRSHPAAAAALRTASSTCC